MKYIFLAIIFTLFAQNASAIDVPFINGSNKHDITFNNSENEEILKPMLHELLQNNYQKRQASNIEINANKRARLDKVSIEKSLRSEGFYSGKVSYEIKDNRIYYKINSGKPYLIDKELIKSNL